MHRTNLTLTLLLLLSGCTQPQPADEADLASLQLKQGIEWTNCIAFAATAFGSSIQFPYPPRPSGWEDPHVPGANEHHLHASYCERVQWGPYERGPVFTLFEAVAGSLTPDSCLEGEVNRWGHFATLWISDAEIAAYANQTLGVPVFAADFRLDETSVGTAVERKWIWSLPGNPSSELAMIESDGESPSTSFVERIFWINGTGISFLDLNKRYELPMNQARVGHGHLEAPMAAARNGFNEYATAFDTHTNSVWSANVQSFRDTLCTEPV